MAATTAITKNLKTTITPPAITTRTDAMTNWITKTLITATLLAAPLAAALRLRLHPPGTGRTPALEVLKCRGGWPRATHIALEAGA